MEMRDFNAKLYPVFLIRFIFQHKPARTFPLT